MFKDLKEILDSIVVLMKDNDLRSVEYSRHADVGEQKDGLEEYVLSDDGITEAVLNNKMITTLSPSIDGDISSNLKAISAYMLPDVNPLKSYRIKAKIKKGFIKITAEQLGDDEIVNTLKVQFE